MSNVYVSLAGGVGNQLFQIAAGYAYSRKYNKNLVLDASAWGASQGTHPTTYKKSFYKNFKFGSPAQDVHRIFETKFNYEEIPYHSGNVALHGYRQSLKYFEEFKDDFAKLLNFPVRENDWIEEKNVAVHVRRGDYITLANIHLVCGTDYFRENIKKFSDYHINVFTDSPQIAKEELMDYGVNIIQGGSEINDLYLMSLHDNIICSNSTFSWWASLLNKKKEKIIVPKIWFNNFEDHHDIYRSDFTISEI